MYRKKMFVCRSFWENSSLPAHDFDRGVQYNNVSVREMRDQEKRKKVLFCFVLFCFVFWDWARYAFRGSKTVIFE